MRHADLVEYPGGSGIRHGTHPIESEATLCNVMWTDGDYGEDGIPVNGSVNCKECIRVIDYARSLRKSPKPMTFNPGEKGEWITY